MKQTYFFYVSLFLTFYFIPFTGYTQDCEAVADLQITNFFPNMETNELVITLNWTASATADFYEVDIKTDAFQFEPFSSDLPTIDLDLSYAEIFENGNQYIHISVVGLCDGARGAPSSFFIDLTAPNASPECPLPINVNTTQEGDILTVAWQNPQPVTILYHVLGEPTQTFTSNSDILQIPVSSSAFGFIEILSNCSESSQSFTFIQSTSTFSTCEPVATIPDIESIPTDELTRLCDNLCNGTFDLMLIEVNGQIIPVPEFCQRYWPVSVPVLPVPKDNWFVFPNPCQSFFQIRQDDLPNATNSNFEIWIKNKVGQTLYHQKMSHLQGTNNNYIVPTDLLPTGIYVVQIGNTHRYWAKRLFKMDK